MANSSEVEAAAERSSSSCSGAAPSAWNPILKSADHFKFGYMAGQEAPNRAREPLPIKKPGSQEPASERRPAVPRFRHPIPKPPAAAATEQENSARRPAVPRFRHPAKPSVEAEEEEWDHHGRSSRRTPRTAESVEASSHWGSASLPLHSEHTR
ncbi:unnamed protein product, partial [Symbiodinium sp. CCMP2456]